MPTKRDPQRKRVNFNSERSSTDCWSRLFNCRWNKSFDCRRWFGIQNVMNLSIEVSRNVDWMLKRTMPKMCKYYVSIVSCAIINHKAIDCWRIPSLIWTATSFLACQWFFSHTNSVCFTSSISFVLHSRKKKSFLMSMLFVR